MSEALEQRIAAMLAREVDPAVAAQARVLGEAAGALAVLFYGSNLRTGSLEGVLDFYVLLPGAPETGLWPRVFYREWDGGDTRLRAKVATMTLAKFAEAAAGATLDTTIWARFVQPSAMVWQRDEAAAASTRAAIADAARTAARLAIALGLCAAVNQLPMPARFQGMTMTWQSGVGAIAALVLVGVATSTYPARRAALLPPVEAPRYEG